MQILHSEVDRSKNLLSISIILIISAIGYSIETATTNAIILEDIYNNKPMMDFKLKKKRNISLVTIKKYIAVMRNKGRAFA